MGNTNSYVGHLRYVLSVWMGASSEGEVDGSAGSSACADAPCALPRNVQLDEPGSVGSDVVAMVARGSEVVSGEVERRIDESKSHWSELSELDSGLIDKDVEVDNWELFKALRMHPTWGGTFFHTFGYDFGGWESDGTLEIGEKFAEGGQAELFHVKVVWRKPKITKWDQENGREWVLKVFKKGTPLRHLQSQWPHGMLQYLAEEAKNWQLQTPKTIPRFFCSVQHGTLLQDGRFAFLMKKEQLDLRTLINRNMMASTNKDCGPFSKEQVDECMFDITLGMSWLHSRGIVHRDLKASNVLIQVHKDGNMQCFVADYECSIGVVGTGFFRAPEILKACKDKSVSKKEELFTKSSDVYSYGMTCYEILTGQMPFGDHEVYDYDHVINGECLEVPRYVDAWVHSLLRECWKYDPSTRPSFNDLVNTILDNSPWIRKLVQVGTYKLEQLDWIDWRSLAMNA